MQVTGLAELHKTLQSLPTQIETNILRGALREGLKVIEQDAKARAPVKDGALRESIKIRFKRQRLKKAGMAVMQVVAGGKAAWYAHLIEYGTASYYTGKGKTVGKPYMIRAKDSTGKELSNPLKKGALRIGAKMANQAIHPGIKPQPFMRPAADLLSGKALDEFTRYVQKRLPKEIKKAGK